MNSLESPGKQTTGFRLLCGQASMWFNLSPHVLCKHSAGFGHDPFQKFRKLSLRSLMAHKLWVICLDLVHFQNIRNVDFGPVLIIKV